MAAAGLDVTPGHCADSFLSKMTEETRRWARIVKAMGFIVN